MYILRVKRDSERVGRVHFGERGRTYTLRGDEAARGSAGRISVKGRWDVQAEGGARPEEGQQGPFQ